MSNLLKRTVIVSLKLFLLGFVYSHMVFPNGHLYVAGSILFAPLLTVAIVYVFLSEVQSMIEKDGSDGGMEDGAEDVAV